MCCLYASANQAPANRPAIAKTTPTVPGTQSGHLFCLATLPIANAIANASAKPAVKHTTKNAISIPTLYHIRDEENVLIQARNLVPAIGDYSTSEQNTGFKWINGSAIYKKTINFGALPSSGYKGMAHNITNFGTLVDTKAILYDTGTSRYKSLNLPQGNNTDWIVLEVNTTHVFTYAGSDFSKSTAYITLYYTKSS